MDDLAPLPAAYVGPPPPTPDDHVLAVERPADPLDSGFFLSDGVLAPLPPKVRLPHDEDAEDELAG
jgi:hypothetical protein